MFSGGSYEDVGRWLHNFLTSHAKREDPRAEVLLKAGDRREGHSWQARVRLADRTSTPLEFDYKDVADHRGSLTWCAAQADRARALTRGLG